jgi:hypothetical protein
MMVINGETFEQIWVSSNFQTVFCTEEEKERYLSYLSSRKEIPLGMSIVLLKKILIKRYAKDEIMNATPEQLKGMIK